MIVHFIGGPEDGREQCFQTFCPTVHLQRLWDPSILSGEVSPLQTVIYEAAKQTGIVTWRFKFTGYE